MTAEVAIMNRNGIAIAADSAVTIGEKRVWKNTNKIFSLGPKHDIGIMIYGSGDFLGTPWEVIIKSFKNKINGNSFERVRDCANSFKDYLKSDIWSDALTERVSIAYFIVKEITEIKNTISYQSKAEFRSELKDIISSCEELIKDRKIIDKNYKFQNFIDDFSEDLESITNDVFEEFIPKTLKNALYRYVYNYISRENCESDFESGVVFCGYGEKETLPVTCETFVDGRLGNFLRFWHGRETDLNIEREKMASVMPFAQRDIGKCFYGKHIFKLYRIFLQINKRNT